MSDEEKKITGETEAATEEPAKPKAEEPKKEVPVEKPAEPKADKPKEEAPVEKPAEPKAEEPKKEAPVKKPAKPKADKPKEEAPVEKPAKPKADKPKKEIPSIEEIAEQESGKAKAKATEEKPVKKDLAPKSAPAPQPKTETPSIEEIADQETVMEQRFEKFKKNINTKLFGKYDYTEVVVTDMGLARYINLDPVYIPHSGGRHAKRMFEKAKVNIIERFLNKLMRTQGYTGKKNTAYKMLGKSFEKIHKRTKLNPIQVFVEALENAAPMEEATRLRFGGISVPKAVDISPSRRLDIALRNIAFAASEARKSKTKHMSDCLADEIMKAAKNDMSCFSLQKKEEKHRYARSAR